jgi:predicted dienelactone hydrolase
MKVICQNDLSRLLSIFTVLLFVGCTPQEVERLPADWQPPKEASDEMPLPLDPPADADQGSGQEDLAPPESGTNQSDVQPEADDLPETEPEIESPMPDLIDPGALGLWDVGVKTVELTDPTRDRTFKVDLWYPVAAESAGATTEYEVDFPLIGDVASLAGIATREAPVLSDAFPLVLFSHGYGGVRFQSVFFTEHLASHGFVVASPDHPGNLLSEPWKLGDDNAALQSSIDRPLDVRFVLDTLLDGGAHLPAVDGEKIGVTGHSFGAWTALEVARTDARIDAVFPLAPGFKETATPTMVEEFALPLLIFGGTEDRTTPLSDQEIAFDLAAHPKHLVRVVGAGHLDFSNLCEVPIAMLFVDDGCDEALIDPAVVHQRVNTIGTAFALTHLADDVRYAALLERDAVLGLGNVEYEVSLQP